jgi:hypothetical protein
MKITLQVLKCAYLVPWLNSKSHIPLGGELLKDVEDDCVLSQMSNVQLEVNMKVKGEH